MSGPAPDITAPLQDGTPHLGQGHLMRVEPAAIYMPCRGSACLARPHWGRPGMPKTLVGPRSEGCCCIGLH